MKSNRGSQQKQAVVHSAGATAQHAGPYSILEVPMMMENPDADFIAKWVKPFYMTNLIRERSAFRSAYQKVSNEIDDALITRLLSYFNWRPSIVGALFAAIGCRHQHCDHIGRLLLRSDVCFAGRGYAMAMVRFNSPAAIDYLCNYLDHYLARPDLFFEQGVVMAALSQLDRLNGTNKVDDFTSRWEDFVLNKPNWRLGRFVTMFADELTGIEEVAGA